MVINCCVSQCNSKQVAGSDIKFHKFPDNIQMVTEWLRAIKSGKKPSKYMKVCSLHFKEEDYKPTIYHGYTKRFLKINAVPSVHLPRTNHESQVVKNVKTKREQLKRRNPLNSDSTSSSDSQDPLDIEENDIQDDDFLEETNEKQNIDDVADPLLPIHSEYVALTGCCENKFTQASQCVPIALYYDRLSDEQFKTYTGLSYNSFDKLFSFLAQFKPSPFDKYLTKRDQLILCLIKYRQNIILSIIGDMYGLPLLKTRQIFIHWTQVMNTVFKAVNWWSLRYKKPDAYTVILHCSEIATKNSKLNPVLEEDWFSFYKKKSTLKYLVGIDEKGTVIFCSDVFCGTRSDCYIVKECGIIDQLREGDIVLADRSFDVSEILIKCVAVNIPPILRNKQLLPSNDILETRVTANRRIFVERMNELAEYNKILSEKIPSLLRPYANEIIFVGNMLSNFKNNVIIKPKLTNR